jgi:hypothetical protein
MQWLRGHKKARGALYGCIHVVNAVFPWLLLVKARIRHASVSVFFTGGSAVDYVTEAKRDVPQ